VCVCSPCVLCVFVRPSQLQEAKQLERERHRQHTEPDSPQLQAHIHPPVKGLSQEANGAVTSPTPSSTVPSTPSTPSTPAAEGRSVSGEQDEQREQEEPGEQGPPNESPDPENGSNFCEAENEQTEADQATAAQSKTGNFFIVLYSYKLYHDFLLSTIKDKMTMITVGLQFGIFVTVRSSPM